MTEGESKIQKGWLGRTRSAIFRAVRWYVQRLIKLQPTPLEFGIILIVVMFPTGVWLSQQADATSQYLSGYVSDLAMLGLGFVLAYLYIDRFNERAKRRDYREVHGAMTDTIIGSSTGLFLYTVGILLKAPADVLEGDYKELYDAYFEFTRTYYAEDRRKGLEWYRDHFKDAMASKRKSIQQQRKLDATFIVLTEQQAVEVINTCEHEIARLSVGITRLVSARLKTDVIEDLVIIENNILSWFESLRQTASLYSDPFWAKEQPRFSSLFWSYLRALCDELLTLSIYSDGLLEGTEWRERQRRGELGHITYSAAKRRADM